MFFDKHKHNPSILHMFPQCFFGLKDLNEEGEFLKWIKTFQSIWVSVIFELKRTYKDIQVH